MSYTLPAIPVLVVIKPDSVWFYHGFEQTISGCRAIVSLNQSGGVTMTAQHLRDRGIKAFTVGSKVFNKATRKWE